MQQFQSIHRRVQPSPWSIWHPSSSQRQTLKCCIIMTRPAHHPIPKQPQSCFLSLVDLPILTNVVFCDQLLLLASFEDRLCLRINGYFIPLLWLNNMPACGLVTLCLSTHQVIDIGVASIVWLLTLL